MEKFPTLDSLLHGASEVLEVMGVGVILVGALSATFYFFKAWKNSGDTAASVHQYRIGIARGILLGLEFLVAAEIIGTVLVSPSMENVIVLGIIVLIRTFLSYSLEIEIHGRLPWQDGRDSPERARLSSPHKSGDAGQSLKNRSLEPTSRVSAKHTFVTHWEGDFESGAPSLQVFNIDGSAVRLDETLRDVEAKPGATVFGAIGLVRLKDPLHLAFGYALSVVLHPEA